VRNPFDQFIKRLARRALSPAGHVETDAEVSPDALRIDVWFLPDAARARKVLMPLGLFGRMCRAACTLEPFHRTPSGDHVAACIVKHWLFRRELRRRKPPPPMPTQWIISSGRASDALTGLNFRKSRWGPGIYDGPALLRTKVVVVSELPRTRDTMLVRLMSAGRTFQHAIADVRALPPDAPERLLALPILVRLRLEIPTDPAKQTKSDREFLMRQRDVDKYLEQLHNDGLEKGLELGRDEGRKEGREEGREEGRGEGFAQAVLAAYRARFGTPPAELLAAVERAQDHADLERWLALVTTRSMDEVTAALRQSRAAKPAARAKTRRSTSPRRASASR
jgi:hypothetical protein